MVTTLRALSSAESLEAPTDFLPSSLRRSLELRGVVLQPLPGETGATREERIDTALMALFRDTRQAQSFDALYGRTRARVFAWVRRLLAQKHCQLDPLEVLQDTYVNVYQYSSRFRDERPESFRVWVRTIAANALRRSRSQLPRRREQPLGEHHREAVAVGVDPTWPLEQREDDRRLAQTWLLFLQHYQSAFSQLALRDRCALELVEVEGLSYADAGSRLAVGPSNMKMIMFRARQRLLLRLQRSILAGRSLAAAPTPRLQAAC
jgi:RNA polymerase sigma factor (sigma-70 family)